MMEINNREIIASEVGVEGQEHDEIKQFYHADMFHFLKPCGVSHIQNVGTLPYSFPFGYALNWRATRVLSWS